MKKLFSVLAPALVLFLLPSSILAHSGRTDSSGGHNCNVGSCAGTYHYHNGGYSVPAYVPVATVKPATPKPTTPRPTQAPTTPPTEEPVVLGVSASDTPTASPIVTQTPIATIEPLVEGSTTKKTILADLGLIGLAVWGYMRYRKSKSLQA